MLALQNFIATNVEAALLEILVFLLYCYIITAISRGWMFITEAGQIFGKWQNVLDWLHEKADSKLNVWQVLYKGLGGCDACNAMWFSLLFYPIYLHMGKLFGFAFIPLNNDFMYWLFWLLAPFVTLDFLALKNRE